MSKGRRGEERFKEQMTVDTAERLSQVREALGCTLPPWLSGSLPRPRHNPLSTHMALNDSFC